MSATAAEPPSERPEIDEFGLVRFRGAWVAVSPQLETALRVLLGAEGAVVRREALEAALWPEDRAPSRRVDALMLRLRRRLLPLGVTIHTIRSKGYLLEIEEARHIVPVHADWLR